MLKLVRVFLTKSLKRFFCQPTDSLPVRVGRTGAVLATVRQSSETSLTGTMSYQLDPQDFVDTCCNLY